MFDNFNEIFQFKAIFDNQNESVIIIDSEK